MITVEKCLRVQPWLRLCNINNISSRFAKETNGNIFVAYNSTKQTYELHSCNLLRLQSGSSRLVVIDEDMLNGYILKDYHANNLSKFRTEVESERQFLESLYTEYEEKTNTVLSTGKLNIVERTLGRQI